MTQSSTHSSTRIFTLAHLSDIHLGPLPRLGVRHMNAKRILGYLNWHKSRRWAHRSDTLARILADLATQAPNHIAVTGDLINIGLPEEYVAAERWLRRLGSPDRVTVVPGNHDIYTRLGRDPGVARWQPYMTAAGATIDQAASVPWRACEHFPFVRRFGRLALIGLNSAVPTRPFHAGGRLGPGQLDRLERVLEGLASEGAIRVVLIHHPPLPGQAHPTKALADACQLAAVLRRQSPEVVLHGHNHVRAFHAGPVNNRGQPLQVVGVGSASLGRPHNNETLASYHIYRFDLTDAGRPPSLAVRGMLVPDGPVGEISNGSLAGAFEMA